MHSTNYLAKGAAYLSGISSGLIRNFPFKIDDGPQPEFDGKENLAFYKKKEVERIQRDEFEFEFHAFQYDAKADAFKVFQKKKQMEEEIEAQKQARDFDWTRAKISGEVRELHARLMIDKTERYLVQKNRKQ